MKSQKEETPEELKSIMRILQDDSLKEIFIANNQQLIAELRKLVSTPNEKMLSKPDFESLAAERSPMNTGTMRDAIVIGMKIIWTDFVSSKRETPEKPDFEAIAKKLHPNSTIERAVFEGPHRLNHDSPAYLADQWRIETARIHVAKALEYFWNDYVAKKDI